MRTCLMHHAACKVEFQPFKWSYSQLTFFYFFIKNIKWKGKPRRSVQIARGHAGSRQLCMLASERCRLVRTKEKSLHSTAQHGTARHRTALRRAVELAKLNGAGDTAVCFLCFQLYAAGCDTEKELEPAATGSD